MYDNHFARTRPARRTALVTAVATSLAIALVPSTAYVQEFETESVVRKISGLSEKLELTTNTSRILTLDKNIPRVQVNNPEMLAVTPLSATQVQISAKKAGVTQVNLWDEEGNIHTVDVMVYGDARELTVALQTQFPHSSIKVYRYSESLVLSGFVDRPDHVGPIMRLAEDYAPKVINNISVGGVQQILLRVKVMEVSRTKLRDLGVDWSHFSSKGVGAVSSVSGLITEVSQFTSSADAITPNVEGGPGVVNNLGTFQFGIVDGDDVFFGFIKFLQERRAAKTLAEPNLVAVSGRPAQFNVGGETPILIPQSLGTTSIEFKPFGTQIDFLPIVLGNGNIRLEVRPRISDLDFNAGIVLEDIVVPGFRVRQVDTAVEMKAGQTFALAGLVQERTNTVNVGVPYLSDLPILGVPFRRTTDDVEEIELLVLVTPEFVDAMEPHQVPCGGPGVFTTSPTNRDLYCGGYVEVPLQCNPTQGMSACGEQVYGYGCSNCGNRGCSQCGQGGQYGAHSPLITDGVTMPGGVGYDNAYGPPMDAPVPTGDPNQIQSAPMETGQPAGNPPDDLQLPTSGEPAEATQPSDGTATPGEANYLTPPPTYTSQSQGAAGLPMYTAPRPYSPPRQPVFMRNASRPNNQQPGVGGAASGPVQGNLIGPVGYDPQ
jgi:pilus assembly protein CpaC